MVERRLARSCGVLLVLCALAACGKEAPAGGGASSAVLAPVPAPATLAADVFLTSPECGG